MEENQDKRVLAIQSHVVYGYVGNKAATFPLQLRKWDVAALNAVQFSNHTGYGSLRGYRLDGDQIEDLYEGLKAHHFEFDALLTGYLPSASAVNAVNEIGADLRTQHKNLVWLLDPVMGDEGKLYVREDVVPAYKKILNGTGVVTIVTPNYFEVELLTGIKLVTKQDVKKALRVFHQDFKVPHVVITSMPHPSDPNKLLTVGSSAKLDPKTGEMVAQPPFVISQEKFDSYFTGTGDLFAALLLDYYHRFGPDELARATLSTIKTLRKVLEKTWDYGKKFIKGSSSIRVSDTSMKYHELRLIQNAETLTDMSIADQNDGSLSLQPYDSF